MKNQPENELLSAYLDGELTPAERARVEKMLAGSPAARQMLDELRALGTTLQALPPHKLNADLSEPVLQAVAKRKSPSTLTGEQSRPRPRPLSRQILERVKNNPRVIVWPMLIVIVAVLLVVFNPDQRGGNGNQNIARLPNDGNREPSAKIVEPKPGDLANSKDQPSISAPGMHENVPNPSQLVMKGNPNVNAAQIPSSAASRAGLIVIQCQVNGETLKQQDYRKVFDANNIPLSDKPASESFQLTPSELAEVAGVDRTLLEENSNAPDAIPKAKVIAVEVSPAQFAGILNGLQGMPVMYRNVSVKMPQVPTAQSSEPAPPPATIKKPSTKRVLIVFRVDES